MFRPELYELRALELGIGMQTSEIVQAMNLMGWKVSESTMSRLRKGSDLNIDVGGLPFFAVRCLFPNAVASIAQTATWMIRRALSQKLAGDDLEDVLGEVEEQIAQAQYHLDQLKPPADDEAKADRALDMASIAEAKGQLAATRTQHLAALDHFLEAYLTLLPFARMAGCPVGITVCLARTLGAALSEAYDCDEDVGRVIGNEPIGHDGYLWKVVQHYKVPSLLPLLVEGVRRTGDDRIAANHADGFALAGEPCECARMMQVGIAFADERATLETWKPHGRSAPVIAEPYMADAIVEYNRLRDNEIKPKSTNNSKETAMKRIIAAIVGLAALFALATHVDPASARPERITGLQTLMNVG
jgi:hypothetical protein